MLGEKLVEKMTKWKKITENCILHSYELKKFSPPPPSQMSGGAAPGPCKLIRQGKKSQRREGGMIEIVNTLNTQYITLCLG